jgi:opacity protein-like surface antigen
MRKPLLVLVALGCLSGGRAVAQVLQEDDYAADAGYVGPIVWNIGGQIAFPLGDSEKRVNTGWGFALGVTYNLKPILGFQFEYGVDWASLKGGTANISGDAVLQYFNLNAVVRPVHSGRIGAYLIGGGGLYYRYARITRFTGNAVYCDPWLFYCSAVPTGTVLGSRSSWDWGLDGGAGVTFAVSPMVRLYAELRYHYIWGPTFHRADGSSVTANGQYLPLTLGVRF